MAIVRGMGDRVTMAHCPPAADSLPHVEITRPITRGSTAARLPQTTEYNRARGAMKLRWQR
jgi:hypothetical protein